MFSKLISRYYIEQRSWDRSFSLECIVTLITQVNLFSMWYCYGNTQLEFIILLCPHICSVNFEAIL